MANTTDKTKTALAALKAEHAAGKREFADREALTAYLADLDAIVQEVRDLKSLYKAELAVEASRRSRAKRKAEVEEMKRRLAALEGAE